MNNPSPRPLTVAEEAILGVVAAAAAEQGRIHPLISRTSVLRAAVDRGLPKMAARAAWHSLMEHGVLASADDGPVTPFPRPYLIASWAPVLDAPASYPTPPVPGRSGGAERVAGALSGYACPDCMTILERAPRVGADGRCSNCRPTISRARRRRVMRGAAVGAQVPTDGYWSQ